MTLPLLRLSGTPYEQGVQHGEGLRDQIAHNRKLYFQRFERELKLGRAEVLEHSLRYADAIGQQNSNYFSGMQGIAAGTGFDFAEIVALNVRYELFYYQFGVNAVKDGCSAFALLPDATADGSLLLGENWDWITGVKGAVLHTTDRNGTETLSFTEAGIVGGKIGLNSAGIGLAINGLTTTDDDWERLSKPFHVRCYEILRAQDFDQAVSIVADTERACSANFIIAQAPDRLVNIEAAPHTIGLTEGDEGCVVHTNHFFDPTTLGVTDPEIEESPHSYYRLDRLRMLLAAHRPATLADVQEALRDHQGYPYSICFHIDPEQPPEEYYESVVSVVIDLHKGELHISDGPPCENPYMCYTLKR